MSSFSYDFIITKIDRVIFIHFTLSIAVIIHVKSGLNPPLFVATALSGTGVLLFHSP